MLAAFQNNQKNNKTRWIVSCIEEIAAISSHGQQEGMDAMYLQSCVMQHPCADFSGTSYVLEQEIID